MKETNENPDFSQKHKDLSEAITKALKKVSEKLIAEAKEQNSYLVISDENGNIKKVYGKDL